MLIILEGLRTFILGIFIGLSFRADAEETELVLVIEQTDDC